MTTIERKTSSLHRRTILTTAVAAVGFAMAPKAHAAGDLVDLEIVDRETGEPARLWRHGGRLFVAGRPGARYSLRVTNNSPGRVLVVMSVDGVNIITGETAAYGQRGYVFEPYDSYAISGWRKSDTEVAAFTFAPLRRSYAARTGRPGDVGVIGIAAFTERVAPPVLVAPRVVPQSSPPPVLSAPTAAETVEDIVVTGSSIRSTAPPPPAAMPAPSPQAARRSERLGTEHGPREWSVSNRVQFERATAYPQLIRRIEYDSYENLVAAGVIPRPRPAPPRPPRPFPLSPDRGGYVPDPPPWR